MRRTTIIISGEDRQWLGRRILKLVRDEKEKGTELGNYLRNHDVDYQEEYNKITIEREDEDDV